MSTQSTLTVTGFVGSTVRFSPGKDGGVPYASFRLGSTHRIYDRTQQAFRDGPTQWYTVKVWRQVAVHVAHSLHKGEPVVVTGRLSTDEWASPEGPRTTLVLEATALGHDLVFGQTIFSRVASPAAGEAQGAAQAEAQVGAGDAGDGHGEAGPADVTGLTELADPEEAGGPGDPGEDEIDEDDVADDELAPLGAALVG